MEVRWIAFPLHPETPEEGLSLEELFKGRDVDIPSALEHLKKTALKLGLPWVSHSRTFNSRRAQELGKWAESLNEGDEFRKAVFEAVFSHERNIAQISVLEEIAGAIGLDVRRARAVLMERAFKEAVDRDWEHSRACGVTAVPTFMAAGRKVVGAQPYETLENLVETAGAKRRK